VETAKGPVQGYVAHRSATGTKTDSSLMETPQSITVVTREQIEAQGARSVAEALRYEPGVVSETRIGDRFDNVFARGFGGFGANANYVHFWDGLRLPRGVNYANPSVDPYLLERVEVLRGPASILYGQNNPGGLVNLISKNPTAIPFREVLFRLGDHGRIEGGFDLGGPIDKDGQFLYRVIGLGRYAGNEVDYTTTERYLIAPAITWRPNLDTTLTVRASYDRDPSSFQPNWLPALGTLQANPNGQIPRSFFSGHPDYNVYDRTQTTVGYEFEHRFSDVWTVRQNLRYMHLDSDFKAVSVSSGGPNPLGYVPAAQCGGKANLCLFRTSTHYVESADTLAVDNQAQAQFDTGILRHTALLGIDYQWVSANAVSNNLGGPGGPVPNVNYLNPVYGTITQPALLYSTDQTRSQLGFYAQDQVRIDRLALVFGVRNDQSRLSTESRNLATGARSAVAEPTDSAWTWRAGATYLFDNGLAPYMSYSTSFEPTLGTDYTGAAFVPTTGKQIEGGIKYQPVWFNGYILLSFFDIRQQNVLMQDTAHAATALCTAAAGFCQAQAGEIRSQGFEVSGKLTPVAGLDLVASYSHADIHITESRQIVSGVPLKGKVPVGAPAHTAALWADYTIQHGALTGFGFGGGVRYISASYGDNINSTAMIVPSYTLVDAALHYDLSGLGRSFAGWKMAFNVTNLFDKEYVSACASNTQCFYGAGRSYLASARFRW
jgi:iron complex outermembrane receptor protein